MNDEDQQAEIVINRSSSRDGGIGWSIRLVRRIEVKVDDMGFPGPALSETDEEYTARVLAKHRELERELLMKVCCHDDCAQVVKEGARE